MSKELKYLKTFEQYETPDKKVVDKPDEMEYNGGTYYATPLDEDKEDEDGKWVVYYDDDDSYGKTNTPYFVGDKGEAIEKAKELNIQLKDVVKGIEDAENVDVE